MCDYLKRKENLIRRRINHKGGKGGGEGREGGGGKGGEGNK